MEIFLTVARLGSGYDFSSFPPWYSVILNIFEFLFFLFILLFPVYLVYLLISRPLKKVEKSKQVLDLLEHAENLSVQPDGPEFFDALAVGAYFGFSLLEDPQFDQLAY